MYGFASTVGFGRVSASILAGVVELALWPLAIVGVALGMNFWLLGDIGGRVLKMERALPKPDNSAAAKSDLDPAAPR